MIAILDLNGFTAETEIELLSRELYVPWAAGGFSMDSIASEASPYVQLAFQYTGQKREGKPIYKWNGQGEYIMQEKLEAGMRELHSNQLSLDALPEPEETALWKMASLLVAEYQAWLHNALQYSDEVKALHKRVIDGLNMNVISYEEGIKVSFVLKEKADHGTEAGV